MTYEKYLNFKGNELLYLSTELRKILTEYGVIDKRSYEIDNDIKIECDSYMSIIKDCTYKIIDVLLHELVTTEKQNMK